MVGLFHGKSHLEMDDDWGYPYFRKPSKWTASTIEANFSDNRFADLPEMDDRISNIPNLRFWEAKRKTTNRGCGPPKDGLCWIVNPIVEKMW